MGVQGQEDIGVSAGSGAAWGYPKGVNKVAASSASSSGHPTARSWAAVSPLLMVGKEGVRQRGSQ